MSGGQLVGANAEVGGGDRDAVEPRGRVHDRSVTTLAHVREQPLDRGDEVRLEDRGGGPGQEARLLRGVERVPAANGEDPHGGSLPDRPLRVTGALIVRARRPRAPSPGSLAAVRRGARRATLWP